MNPALDLLVIAFGIGGGVLAFAAWRAHEKHDSLSGELKKLDRAAGAALQAFDARLKALEAPPSSSSTPVTVDNPPAS